MDATNPKVMKNITEKKTDWSEKINKNVEMGSINEEKDMIIERYEKVLNFLKGVQITNDEDLVHIKKPLDDLESYLKYIPNGPLFNDVIPTEVKDTILSYLCDSKAFIAACVCQEWKTISDNRFKEEGVIIGEKCSKCEDNGCVKTEDMLRAAADHEIDVHLVISESIAEIDSQLVTDALINVAKFTLTGSFDTILSIDQFEHLIESIEKGDTIMEEVKLQQLNLKDLNEEKLVNCFVNKIKRLTLFYVCVDFSIDLNYDVVVWLLEDLMTKLQQDSDNLKLTHLTMSFCFSQYPDNVADGLCKVENVKLCDYEYVSATSEVVKRLMENILQMPIVMKTLLIDIDDLRKDFCPDFGDLINPQDLKTVFSKMATLHLEGIFTLEQLEAVRSLPDVEVCRKQSDSEEFFFHSLKKGPSGMFLFHPTL